MAVAVTQRDKVRLGRIWKLYLTLVFSGNYGTPGDILTLAAQKLSQSGRAAASKPRSVVFQNTSLLYRYIYVPGTTRDNGHVTIVDQDGVELSDAAYPAGVSSDVVWCSVEVPA